MKGKRICAWLLLSVYLLTVAVPALCTLTCPCLHRGCRTELPACALCSGEYACPCGHGHLAADESCHHDHTPRAELYTSDRGDARESLRMWMFLLATALPAERLSLPTAESSWVRVASAPEHCVCACCSARSVLRAPPVRA